MTQPEALRLADELDQYLYSVPAHPLCTDAAAELRRLHAERAAADGVINDLVAKVRELQEANEAFGKRQEWWNEKMLTLEAQRGALLEQRDELRRALEIIAVGDATNPQAQAAEELIALGYWRDIPEARAAIRARTP